MATALLEQITDKELRRYYGLASSSATVAHVEQHGIPVDGNSPVTYSVAKRIDGRSLEFLLRMWGRSAHQGGIMLVPMHLEMEANESLIAIALHDAHQDQQSIERLRIEASLHVQFNSAQDELVVGYTIPSAGIPQRLVSIIFPDGKDGRILRFLYDAKTMPTGSGASSPKQESGYTIPKGYENADIRPGHLKKVFGLHTARGYLKKSNVFSGGTLARRASLADFVKDAGNTLLSGNDGDENYKKLLRLVGVPDSIINGLEATRQDSGNSGGTGPNAPSIGQAKGGKRRYLIYTERPDVLPYNSVLSHPEAPLPDNKTVADLLGIKTSSVQTGIYSRHPWIKKEGTIGAFEYYLHFRAQNIVGKNHTERESELAANLDKLQVYEASRFGPKPSPPTTDARQSGIYSGGDTQAGSGIQDTADGTLEDIALLGPSGAKSGGAPATGQPSAVYDPRHVFSYNCWEGSEFAAQLNAGQIPVGAFIYSAGHNEIGTLKRVTYKDGKPEGVCIELPTKGLKVLLVNETNVIPRWQQDIYVPKGIRLPDELIGTQGSAALDGNNDTAKPDGWLPIDAVIGRGYTHTELYTLLGIGNGKKPEDKLKDLGRRNLLVPDEHGTYKGADVARYAIRIGLDSFFSELGYSGTKENILRVAGLDLEARTNGGNNTTQQTPAVKPASEETGRNSTGRDGDSVEARIREYFAGDNRLGDALALGRLLSQCRLDRNTIVNVLPGEIGKPSKYISSILGELVKAKIVEERDTVYSLKLPAKA